LHDTARRHTRTHARQKNRARTQPAMHKTAHQMTRAPPYAAWLVTAWYWIFQNLITYLDDMIIIQACVGDHTYIDQSSLSHGYLHPPIHCSWESRCPFFHPCKEWLQKISSK
jgi:hypothetical protein